MMPLRSARLVSLPVRATEDDYAAAAAELDATLAALPECVAVYRTGGVSSPGISDIDRIVVTNGGPVANVWPRLSARTRELAMHSPFAAEAAVFGRHRELAHLEPLELVHGVGVDLEARPEPELIELLLAAEAAVVLLLRLTKSAVTGSVKVRSTLCALHGLRHDLALARIDSEEAPAAWRLAHDVAALRESWFAEQPVERFRDVLSDAPDAVAAALNAMAARAERFVELGAPGLRLNEPWRRARVSAGVATATQVRAIPQIAAGSRRAGELGWRVLGADVALPTALVALLAGDVKQPYRPVLERRRELAREHFPRVPDGYGGLGSAGTFVR